MTGTRRHRYIITVVYRDEEYTEVSAFSRRDKALKEAKRITKTWERAERVTVTDTVAWWKNRNLFEWTSRA